VPVALLDLVQSNVLIMAGGLSFIIGALAFVVVFSWLAAKFDYPKILDGEAADVLPRLRSGGARMRAVWAIYAFLPLFLVVGAVGARAAFPTSAGLMSLALVFAAIGALAMCLGLMRWPSIHWVLADAYEKAGPDARLAIGANFTGLNVYLGNYIGEFLGELCLGVFFLLSALALCAEPGYPAWLGICGAIFAALFVIGAFRNVQSRVQWLADINNYLLPLWMIAFGVALVLK
jgi:hypothetical protein